MKGCAAGQGEGGWRWKCVSERERETRLRWFAHVQRMDNGCIRQRMTKMELQAGGKEEGEGGHGEGWCDRKVC